MNSTVCVTGIGYVGLQLATSFDETGHEVIAYDVDEDRIGHLSSGRDPTGEVGDEVISSSSIEFTTDRSVIERADYVLIAVPTPVDEQENPNLDLVADIGETIGNHLQEGVTVVLESTVYPGATKEILIPAIERTSGLVAGDGFSVGYSPERIVPGNDTHSLEDVIKIVGGQTDAVVRDLAKLYETVVDAGVHRAPSIEVAEAAKCLENIQRDLNIALINEMAIVCNTLGIDTHSVLEAAGTKSNFHDYRPGLVGGHCIPVDPFFLIYQSKRNGHLPKLVEHGRKVNEYVPTFVGELTLKELCQCGKRISGSTVLVLGLAYKPNVDDIRTSAVSGVVDFLETFDIDVVGFDPHVDSHKAQEMFDIDIQESVSFSEIDATVLATPHDELVSIDYISEAQNMAPDPLLVDVMGALDAEDLRRSDRLSYRRL